MMPLEVINSIQIGLAKLEAKGYGQLSGSQPILSFYFNQIVISLNSKEIWNKKWHSEIYIAPIRKKYSKDYFMKLGLECLRNYYRINFGPNISTKNLIGNEIDVSNLLTDFHDCFAASR